MRKFICIFLSVILTTFFTVSNVSATNILPGKQDMDSVIISKPLDPVPFDPSVAIPNIQIGNLTLQDIENTSSQTYLPIALLVTEYQSTNVGYATGFMVSKKCLLTAGHIFYYKQDTTDLAVRVTAYFGVKSGENINNIKNYVYKVTADASNSTFYYDRSATSNYNSAIDYGGIVFNYEIGQYTGTFGIKLINDESSYNRTFGEVAGYNTTAGVYLKSDYSYGFDSVKDTTFHHYADTVNGMSGGPIFGTDRFAFGINVAESATSNQYNVGYRFNNDFYYNKLLTWGYN